MPAILRGCGGNAPALRPAGPLFVPVRQQSVTRGSTTRPVGPSWLGRHDLSAAIAAIPCKPIWSSVMKRRELLKAIATLPLLPLLTRSGVATAREAATVL